MTGWAAEKSTMTASTPSTLVPDMSPAKSSLLIDEVLRSRSTEERT